MTERGRMDVAGQDRWTWCPTCGAVEYTHFVRCLCCNYGDRELVITIEVPARLLERIESACRLGGWEAAQAIAETWEVSDVRGGGSADRDSGAAGILLPT